MEQGILFIANYLREHASFTELCARFGISRKTGHKGRDRYRLDGVEGPVDRNILLFAPTRKPTIREGEYRLKTDQGV